MKRYYLYLVILCSLLSSCKSDILPHHFKTEKKLSFYNELQKVTIYKVINYKNLNINSLNSYPKSYDEYISSEWNYIDSKKEPYLSLKRNTLIFEINSNYSKDQQFLLNFFEKIELDSHNYYVSGIYKPMLINSVDYGKHYYIHYILDVKGGQVIEFDNRDMW